jgi:hypothetical protein
MAGMSTAFWGDELQHAFMIWKMQHATGVGGVVAFGQ